MDAPTDRTPTGERPWASAAGRTPPPGSGPASVTIGPLDVLRLLRSAGGALLTQAHLHAQLARLEWAQARRRLAQLLATAAFGFASALCLMSFVGVAGLAIAWDTAYRIPTAIAVSALYGTALLWSWRRLRALNALVADAFAASRGELAADFALLKSRL